MRVADLSGPAQGRPPLWSIRQAGICKELRSQVHACIPYANLPLNYRAAVLSLSIQLQWLLRKDINS
jgi:hypothetical protein